MNRRQSLSLSLSLSLAMYQASCMQKLIDSYTHLVHEEARGRLWQSWC